MAFGQVLTDSDFAALSAEKRAAAAVKRVLGQARMACRLVVVPIWG